MSYKKYLSIITGIAVIGWISFLLVIYKLEPCSAPGEISLCHSVSSGALFLFFLSAFFALTGTCAGLGFGLRVWFNQYEIYLDHLSISIRQGILLTLCAMGALSLLLLNALTWWSGLLFIAIIMLIELYFTRAAG